MYCQQTNCGFVTGLLKQHGNFQVWHSWLLDHGPAAERVPTHLTNGCLLQVPEVERIPQMSTMKLGTGNRRGRPPGVKNCSKTQPKASSDAANSGNTQSWIETRESGSASGSSFNVIPYAPPFSVDCECFSFSFWTVQKQLKQCR